MSERQNRKPASGKESTRKPRKRAADGASRKPAKKTPAARGGGRKSSGRAGSTSWPLRIAKWTAVAAIWLFVFGFVGYLWISWDLPGTDALAPAPAEVRRQAVTLHAEDGSVLASYGDLWGQRLTVAELPPQLAQAVMAIEDRRFYEHGGVDPRGVLRAVVANLRAGGLVQGGSTLTQQLAKNLFLTPERSLERKLKELVLALRLERRFTKDEILTIYLNRVYLGAGAYGVEAASQRYFGHSARALDTYEAALLAGLLKAPSRYNPRTDLDAARERTRIVLAAMVEAGYLARRAADAAIRKGEATEFVGTRALGGSSRYFTDWALERASGYAGATTADLSVTTTLDPHLQAIAAEIADKAEAAGMQIALVAMTPDGAVRAMIGGVDYGDSQFNRATQALRQPGSAFKPLVYLPALEAGMTPDSVIEDAPITVEGWSPENFSRSYRGPVSLRTGMAQSLNTVAVRVTESVGRDNVIRAARRLGITSPLTPHPALALGAGEVTLLDLTAAYAVFANGGSVVIPYGVREVRADARAIYRNAAARRAVRSADRVVDPGAAAAMTELLAAVVHDGTGRAAQLDRPAAGKTGTSQDYRDAWFVGYTADLVTGIWLGHDDGTPLSRGGKPVTGGGLPAQLWHDFMMVASKGRPVRGFDQIAQGDASGVFGDLLRRITGGGEAAQTREDAVDPTFARPKFE